MAILVYDSAEKLLSIYSAVLWGAKTPAEQPDLRITLLQVRTR